MRLPPLSYSLLLSKQVTKMRYKCDVCNHIYNPDNGDPEHGIREGTDLKDLPSNWACPVCGIEKDYFYLLENKNPEYLEKSQIVSILGNMLSQELKKQWHNIHG